MLSYSPRPNPALVKALSTKSLERAVFSCPVGRNSPLACKSRQRALAGYNRLKNVTTQVVRIQRVNIEPGAQALIGMAR